MSSFRKFLLPAGLAVFSSVAVHAKDLISSANPGINGGVVNVPPVSVGDFNVRGSDKDGPVPYEDPDGNDVASVDMYLASSGSGEWWVNSSSTDPWNNKADADDQFAYHHREDVEAGGFLWSAWSFKFQYFDYTSEWRHTDGQIPNGSIIAFGLSDGGTPYPADIDRWGINNGGDGKDITGIRYLGPGEFLDPADEANPDLKDLNLKPTADEFPGVESFAWQSYVVTGGAEENDDGEDVPSGDDLNLAIRQNDVDEDLKTPLTDYVVFVRLPEGKSFNASGKSFNASEDPFLSDDEMKGLGMTDEIVFNWTIDSKNDKIGLENPEFGTNIQPDVCTLEFTDGSGGAPLYLVGDGLFIEVEDAAANADAEAADTLTVTVTNDETGETETVTLTETGDDTGIFTNTTGFPTTDSGLTGNDDGALNVQFGQTITASSLAGGAGAACTDTYLFPTQANLTKAVDLTKAVPGDELNYTITPRYPGAGILTDVMVTDGVPDNTTIVGSPGQGGSHDGGSPGIVTWSLGSVVAGVDGLTAGVEEGAGANYEDDLDPTSYELNATGGPVSTGQSNSSGLLTTWSSNWFAEVRDGGDSKVKFNNNLEVKSKDGDDGDFAIASRVVPLAGHASATVTIDTTEGVKIAGGSVLFEARYSSSAAWETLYTFSNGDDGVDFEIGVMDESTLGGALTATAEIRFRSISDGGGESKIKLAEVKVDGTLVGQPELTSSISAYPLLLADGDTLTVEVELGANLVGVDGVNPSSFLPNLAGANGATLTLQSGLAPATANIAAGTSQVFTYTYRVDTDSATAPGSFSFASQGSGDGGSITWPSATSNSVLVSPPLTYKVEIGSSFEGLIPNIASISDSSGTIPPTDSNEVETVVAIPLGSLSGFVRVDTDNDGDGEIGLGDVILTLKDSAGSDIDSDGNAANGTQPTTTTTASDGSYNFTGLLPGSYRVVQTQPAGYLSVSDVDGANDNIIGEETPIVVVGGSDTPNNDFVEELPASLGDLVWLDLNGDGQQSGGGEIGLEGVLVRLLDADNANAEVATALTDASGNYLFDDLTPGNYVVEFVRPNGYEFTSKSAEVSATGSGSDSDVDEVNGQTANIATLRGDEIESVDAGLVVSPGTGAIGNYIWLDENSDGVQDAGEAGIPNVTVDLLNSGGTVIATVVTDAQGGYLFDGLGEDDYTVRVNGGSPPTGLTLTSDPDATADNLHDVALSAGEEYLLADFGYNWVPPISTDTPPEGAKGAIGDRVWSDADGDGVQDAGEAGIAGVTVTLSRDSNGDGIPDTVVGTKTTDGSGNYIFTDLDPDAYFVSVGVGVGTPLEGATQTGDPDGTIDNQTTSGVILAPGDVYLNADFGYQLPSASSASIGDTIYLDADANGAFDAVVDKGIAGVTVALVDLATGDVAATTTTNENGFYTFPGLPTGTGYRVEITDTDHVIGDLTEAQDPDGGADRKSTVANLTTDDDTQDFGFVPAGHTSGEGLIGDTIFIDLDGGDDFDPGEGIEGVTVSLFDTATGQLIETTQTDENGNYFFGGLDKTKSYDVTVDTTGALNGLTNSVDPDNNGDSSTTVDLGADVDGVVLTADFGYVGTNDISGLVWLDPNADGIRAGGETDRFGGVTVDLLDSEGNIVAQTTTGPDGSYSFDNVPDGTYTVDVTDDANVLEGYWHSIGDDSAPDPTTVTVNAGEPSSTIDFGYYVEPGAVSNFVWNDLNGDGDQDAGEPGIGGVPVTLTVTYPNGDVITSTQLSSPTGEYRFEGLLDEDYSSSGVGKPTFVVTASIPGGFIQTISNATGVSDALDSDDGLVGESAEVVQGGEDDTNDFGFVQTAILGNYIWLDENGDGIQDAGEDGIPGVIVNLRDEDGAFLGTTVTDANGGYLFNYVRPNVEVRVVVDTSTLPSGLTHQTGDPDSTLDGEYTVTLAPGEEDLTADFGYNYAPPVDTDTPPGGALGTIGDRVWNDADGDGVQDAGEAGIAGVEVKLYTDPDGNGIYDTLEDTKTTDASGNYAFDDLPAGSYRVEVTPPSGYTQTLGDPDGTIDNATTSPVILAPGDVYLNADFGYAFDSGAADIGDTIYLDVNGNGTFEGGTDIGIAGVTVALLDPTGNFIATTTTDSNGIYLFPGLPSGDEYNIFVSDTDNVLGDLVQTADPDGALDGGSNVASLSASGNLDQDFGYAPRGVTPGSGYIGDTIYIDTDDSGDYTAGEGVEGVIVELYDKTGNTLINSTVTNDNGTYGFAGLDPVETYVVKVDTTGVLTGLSNIEDPQGPADSESIVDLSTGTGIDLDQDFGYAGPNDISGLVWLDPNADGTRAGGETGRFGGVTVDLLDSDGNIVAQTTTEPDGSYSFDNVPDGTYTVDVTDDANVLAGYWHSIGADSAPDPTSVTVDSGNTSATIDFGYYIEPAVVGDFVFNDIDLDGLQDLDDTPAPGVVVTLTATYPNDDVVTATTVTAPDGSYSFGNLLNDEDYSASGGPGEPTFVLTVTYPDGLAPTLTNQGGDDAADSDDGLNGESAEVVQGGADNTNDFGLIVAPKSASFADFVADNSELFNLDDNSIPGVPAIDPLTGGSTGSVDTNNDDFGTPGSPNPGLTGNVDGDVYNNLVEFALCFDPGSGAKVFPSGARNEGFHLELNGSSLDAKFNKPAGVTDVTYEVEISSDGQSWSALTGISPTEVDGPVNGSKTVCYPGIDTSSPGLLRLKVTGTGALGSTVSAVTGPVGWQMATIKDLCQTYADPLLNPCLVTGIIDSVNTGSGLVDLSQAAGSQSLTTVLVPGPSYYIEIMGGDQAGHRFDIESFTDDSITLAADSDLCGLSLPFNTRLDFPADLAGDLFVIRAHKTLNELFPIDDVDTAGTVEGFAAGANATNAGVLLRFDRAGGGLETYIAESVSGVDGESWVASGAGVTSILPPGEGIFVHNLLGAAGFDILQYGEVRLNEAVVPLCEGFNFVAPAHPLVAQSIDGGDSTSRLMNSDDTGGKFVFEGSGARSLADQVQFWDDDNAASAADIHLCYQMIFYLESPDGFTPVVDQWSIGGTPARTEEEGKGLFDPTRSAMYNIQKDDMPDYYIPSPISNAVN